MTEYRPSLHVQTSKSDIFNVDEKRPQNLLSGMNKFLSSLEITFRRDPTNFRPRINKADSMKDKEQKLGGNYFFLESEK